MSVIRARRNIQSYRGSHFLNSHAFNASFFCKAMSLHTKHQYFTSVRFCVHFCPQAEQISPNRPKR